MSLRGELPKTGKNQSLDGLGAGIADVDQTLVGAALELLTAVLILVDGAKDGDDLRLGGQDQNQIRYTK